MKRDFNQPICNFDGVQLTDDNKPVTLATVAINALLAVVPNETTTGEAKARRYALALKINADPGDVNVTVEELALLKAEIGKVYAPLVVGRAYDLLEEKTAPKVRFGDVTRALVAAAVVAILAGCMVAGATCEREIMVRTRCEAGAPVR